MNSGLFDPSTIRWQMHHFLRGVATASPLLSQKKGDSGFTLNEEKERERAWFGSEGKQVGEEDGYIA